MRAAAWLGKKCDPTHWSYGALEKRQYLGPRPPVIIANSEMVRSHFAHYYGVPASDIGLVRSAIRPERFARHDRMRQRLEWRQRWGIGAGDTVALFAAINYRLKGLDCLLRAVRRLTGRSEFRRGRANFRLIVAGSPRNARYRRLAKRLGISDRVVFAGHCPDMRNCYFAADFFVHPTFYDPCSLVVLEALACSLPVITTQVNGASELMAPPEDGYLIDDPHDHDQLAWCMAQLLDPGRRMACAQAAREAASRWTFDQHYQALMNVLSEAARRRGHATKMPRYHAEVAAAAA